MKRILGVFAILTGLFASSGCSTNTGYDSTRPNIVVSNQSYADLVRELFGSGLNGIDSWMDLQVLNDSPNVSGHDFEPSAKDRLMVANADLVIYTGTDVDQFVPPLLESVGFDQNNVLVANDYRAADIKDNENPHLWYDIDSDVIFAKAINERLLKMNPVAKESYDKAIKVFISAAKRIKKYQSTFNENLTPGGKIAVAPENVAGYFLDDLGFQVQLLNNKLENGVELSVKEMEQEKAFIKNSGTRAYFGNREMESAQADELYKYAKELKIPVMKFSENYMCFDQNQFPPPLFTECFFRQITKTAIKVKIDGKWVIRSA